MTDHLYVSAFEQDEVTDIDELSEAILIACKKQTRQIQRLKREVERLKSQAAIWIIRAGTAEGMTDTQIKEMIRDMKGE